MKKKILISMTICMTASGMVACSRPKGDLTYGTLVPHTIFSLVELTSDELYNRLFEKKRLFFLQFIKAILVRVVSVGLLLRMLLLIM